MPKKPNFLGGMQNYNEHTGEYEPALTGANGQVVKDADGDGKTHEGKKQTYDKMRKVLAKEGYPADSYSDEEVDRAFTSLEKSIDAEDDKWRNKQKEKLTFEKAVKNADKDVLDNQFGKDTPERKLVGSIKEQDFNDPKERESLKEEEKDFNKQPISQKEVNQEEKLTYDKFFESPTNKQIVDDYVSDYFDRAKRQGEQANISADQIVEEFKKDWSGFYSEETLPLIKERIQDKIGYPKGTSKEYTQKINKQFDESYKTLKEKYGFTDEQLKSDKVSETIDHILQVYDNFKFSGGKSKWNEQELKEIHSLLDVLDDKYYNDSFIRLAPYGF